MSYCAVVEDQAVVPGFAAHKVGKALFLLGTVGRASLYTDTNFACKQTEIDQALELVSGRQGAENIHSFVLSFQQTHYRVGK